MMHKNDRPQGRALWQALGQMAALWAVAAVAAALLLPGGTRTLPPQPWAAAAMALWLCVGLPAAEELVFRGGVLRLMQPLGPGVALAGQAVLFAAAHGTGAEKLYALAMGLIFGWGAQRTGRIWPGLVLHSINNWIVLAGCLAGRGA